MKILAIETTCDDTGIAIIDDGNVIFDAKLSSQDFFLNYGGIIPELAARMHGTNIIELLKKVVSLEGFNFEDILYIAYASEPGLIGSLHVGKIFADTLAWFYNLDIIKINHIYAHCYSGLIGIKKIEYPFLSLIASGGTTSIFIINSPNDIKELNKKADDALGEAYDKVGRLLKLPYPGGPEIDKLYNYESVKKIFKKQSIESDFSFSGAKSKIKNLINSYFKKKEIIPVEMLASSFQDWAINLLIDKIIYYKKKYDVKYITIGGGVASNSLWREQTTKFNLNIIIPKKKYCCDNAAMIGYYAFQKTIINE